MHNRRDETDERQVWSNKAKNSTFRAVSSAGFNKARIPNLQDTMMLSEPVAAASYTARCLKEELGKDFLRVSDDYTTMAMVFMLTSKGRGMLRYG